MAGNRYLSHWNLRGLLPYHRYHFAGGHDYVQENLSRMTVISADPFPISAEPLEVLRHLVNSHQRFMEETPPLDGHRKAILDPGQTHVGVGLAVSGSEFTMGELFLKRYVRLEPLPDLLPQRAVRVEGEILRNGFGPFYAALFYEGFPLRRTPTELNMTYAHADPSGKLCASLPPWKMSFNTRQGRFGFRLAFRDSGPGYYRLVLWVRQPVREIPYRLSRPGSYEVRTEDGIACASWVFRTAV
jgi:hypothetical protein